MKLDSRPFKENVFDEEVLKFFLGIIELAEFSGVNPAILRKALLDTLKISTSMEELTGQWTRLSLLLSAVKTSPLQNRSTFSITELLNAAQILGEVKVEHLNDFLLSAYKLAGTKSFSDWSTFFRASIVSAERTTSIDEFFTTVRHIADINHFATWPEFFTMVKRLKERPSTQESEVFSAVRHGIQYFDDVESIKGMFRVLAESPQSAGAFAYGQLDSKKWLIEEAQKVWGSNWGTVFVLAGWIGVLPRMIFDKKITVTKIRSFDVDSAANHASEFLNQTEVQKDWLFKSSSQDITKMCYPTTFNVTRKDGSLCELIERPDVVINTSCEHIENVALWFSQIPDGTRVILQSNDGFHIPEHVSCFKSLEDFVKAMPLLRTEFVGEKALPEFNRFMLIGVK
jgi:hypothetical protein